MLKLIKLASFVVAAISLCGVGVIVMMGLKGDPDIEAILAKDGVVTTFKASSGGAGDLKNPESLLLKQAAAFANLINPPPPPPPPVKKADNTQVAVTKVTPPVVEVRKPVTPPPPPPPPIGKFNLIATVMYSEHPEKSLAMVKTLSQGYKWIRQGEELGGLTFHEIKDGSVVLYQGNVKNTELFVPNKPEEKSLLKSNEGAGRATASNRPNSVNAVGSGNSAGAAGSNPLMDMLPPEMRAAMETEQAGGQENAEAARADRIAEYSRSRSDDGSSRTTVTRAIRSPGSRTAVVRPEPKPLTPEEQKAQLDESIKGISEMMELGNPEATPEEREQEKQTWEALLKILEAEKAGLEEKPKDEK